MIMERHITYFNLLDASKEKGCPICFLIKNAVNKSMDNFLYENVNDPGVRKEIRKSLGYCNFHAWQLQKIGDGLGLGIIYEELLNILTDKIEGCHSHQNKNISHVLLKELLQNKAKLNYHEKSKLTCPICRDLRECEKRYITAFIEYFNDAEFHKSFKFSFGLCLPHFLLL